MSNEIKNLLAKAPFSFVGTVLHLGAATMTKIGIDEYTAVVRVDYVLHAPEPFTRIGGHWITLRLAKDVGLPAVQQTLAFFARGLVFGETIVMAEVGRLPVQVVEPYIKSAVEADAIAGAFSQLLRQMELDKLRKHMLEADAVVLGTVVAMEKAGPTTGSEHDPDWWRALIDVYHVEREKEGVTIDPGKRKDVVGVGKVMELTVLFANSPDVRWHTAPKCRASQNGVWVLHRTAAELQEVAPFQILHPEDYQPTQQLDLIR